VLRPDILVCQIQLLMAGALQFFVDNLSCHAVTRVEFWIVVWRIAHITLVDIESTLDVSHRIV